jgi:hypothetical protein
MTTYLTFAAIRATFEKAFAGLAAIAIIALIFAGTFAMCAPDVTLV